MRDSASCRKLLLGGLLLAMALGCDEDPAGPGRSWSTVPVTAGLTAELPDDYFTLSSPRGALPATSRYWSGDDKVYLEFFDFAAAFRAGNLHETLPAPRDGAERQSLGPDDVLEVRLYHVNINRFDHGTFGPVHGTARRWMCVGGGDDVQWWVGVVAYFPGERRGEAERVLRSVQRNVN